MPAACTVEVVMDNDAPSPTPSAFGPKQVILAFLVVLIGYLGVYHWIEYRRHFRGPWEVVFTSDARGTPILTIHQAGLHLTKQLRFEGEIVSNSNLPATLLVDKPGRKPPMGQIIYEDLTFLPGVVTLNLFGHEVELMPRVLLLNKREVAWAGPEEVAVSPEEKPAIPPAPPSGGTRERQD